jgi:hypothetical protein
MAYLGHRQRTKGSSEVEIVDESVDQIVNATGISRGSVHDVLRFLAWAGWLITVRHGGGRSRRPTVRHLNTSAWTRAENPREMRSELDGISGELDGIEANLDGEHPITPRELSMQQCVSVFPSSSLQM